MRKPRKIVLQHFRAPGDTAVLTGLVRDIALTRPGEFQIDVHTHAMDLWNNNPHITPLPRKKASGVEFLKLDYRPGLKDQNYEPIHFLAYFHRIFEAAAKVRIPLTLPYPDLHLSEQEKNTRPINGRYWVIFPGGKEDFTIKVWNRDSWIDTVTQLQTRGIQCVQLGCAERIKTRHTNPELPGVLDLVGQTTLRQAVQLIAHADGVICGVTAGMHIAAALHKPCIVLAGGREAWWWEAYVQENKGLGGLQVAKLLQTPHKFLHTIGLLKCCAQHGCWKNKVIPLNDDKSLCYLPVVRPGQAVARCMDMITPAHVVKAVMEYYTDNSLPPIEPVASLPAVAAPRVVAPPSVRLHAYDIFSTPAPATAPATAPDLDKLILAPKLTVANSIVLAGKPVMKPQSAPDKASEIFNNPIIGGKFTIFVLMFSEASPRTHHELHRRCLDSIIATVPLERMDLRIGSNSLCPESVAYIDKLMADGIVSKPYRNIENRRKYPVMREMFWDPEHPINTKWVIWFDDDSIADRDPQWLAALGQTILQQSPEPTNNHMFGRKYTWALQNGQANMYRQRPWYKGLHFRDKVGRPTPNGNTVMFATGGFWAISLQAIRACDIPDTALLHNGGDVAIGEQLYQCGFGLGSFNAKNQHIAISAAPRRGLSEPHFGTANYHLLASKVGVK